jgi:hypothetical protein
MTWALPEQHLLPDAVVAFVDGELTPLAHERAATHAARCLCCAADIAAQHQARSAVRSADTPGAPAGLLAALRAIPQEVDLPTAPDGLAVTRDGQLVAIQRPSRPTPARHTPGLSRSTPGLPRPATQLPETSPVPAADAAATHSGIAATHSGTAATHSGTAATHSGTAATHSGTAATHSGTAATHSGTAATSLPMTSHSATSHSAPAHSGSSRPEAFAAGEPLGSSPRLGEGRSVLGRRAGAGVVVSGLFLGALALVNTSGGAPAWLNTAPRPGDVEWVSSVGSRLFSAR